MYAIQLLCFGYFPWDFPASKVLICCLYSIILRYQLEGHRKVFMTGKAKLNSEHYFIKYMGSLANNIPYVPMSLSSSDDFIATLSDWSCFLQYD